MTGDRVPTYRMDGREALEALTHARHRLEDAVVEVQRAQAYYGRMHAAAAAVLSAKRLTDEGFPPPGATPARETPGEAAVGAPALPEDPRRLLYVEEVAAILGRTPSSLRYLIRAGKAPTSAKVGGRRMFKAGDVRAWIDAQFAAGQVEELTGLDKTLAAHTEVNPFKTTARSNSAAHRRTRPKG